MSRHTQRGEMRRFLSPSLAFRYTRGIEGNAALASLSRCKFAISPDVFRAHRSRPRLFVTIGGFLAFLLSRVSVKVTGKSLETAAAAAAAPRP